MISVQPGNAYTFTFTTGDTSLFDELLGSDSFASAAQAIIDAGFPVSGIKWTGAGSNFDFNFTYNGQATDSDALGQAMSDAINQVNVGPWSLASAESGIPVINPSTPGAGIVDQVKAALPSPTSFAIIAALILLAVVFTYSFAGAVGSKVA